MKSLFQCSERGQGRFAAEEWSPCHEALFRSIPVGFSSARLTVAFSMPILQSRRFSAFNRTDCAANIGANFSISTMSR